MRVDELLKEAKALVSNDVPATNMGCVMHLLILEVERTHPDCGQGGDAVQAANTEQEQTDGNQ